MTTVSRYLTLDDAARLPNILIRIAPAMLRQHGRYSYTEVQADGHRIGVTPHLVPMSDGLPCDECGADAVTPCGCHQ
jgi:hypothetical protein